MKDNKNVILYILSYLTKYSKKNNKIPTYEEYNRILEKLNYESLSKDRHLYQFFVDNVDDNVNWKEFDLTPFSNIFINKIKLIASGQKRPDELFPDPIDDYFTGNNHIYFSDKSLTFNFSERDSKFLLDLIGYSEDDMWYYYRSRSYDYDCYEPEKTDDELMWIMRVLDNDNLEKLSEITKFIGASSLRALIQSRIQSNQKLSEDIALKIIKLFNNLYEDELDNIFNEYNHLVRIASCESIKEAFENSFPDGITYHDGKTLEVSYDFFISFLEKNPEIKTFADLKNHNFMYGDDLSQAMYEYVIDLDALNREVYSILDKILDNILDEMDDDDNLKKFNNLKKFDDTIKELKFKEDERGFYVKDTRKYSFVINPDKVDYNNGKLRLDVYFKHGDSTTHNRDHIIPFDDLQRYVTIEQLFENILSRFL